MRIAVANDWYDKKSAVFFNKDGFLSALGIIAQEHDLRFFKMHERSFTYEHECGFELDFGSNVKERVLAYEPDVILFFCDFSRPLLKEFEGCGIPMAIAFTGGPFRDHETVPDIVFVESQSYFDDFKDRGLNVKRAFGVNVDLFKPMPQPRIFDAVFPATMADWKRHKLFAEAMGERGLACGFWQPHEPHVIENLQQYKTAILHHQNAESCNLIYNMGKTCLVTSRTDGGSQRTVLEAMACNVPVITMSDSEKTSEYVLKATEDGYNVGAVASPDVASIRHHVDEWKDKMANGREWIKKNYSAEIYAKQMLEGMESICSR